MNSTEHTCDIFNLGFIIFQCPLTTMHHLYNEMTARNDKIRNSGSSSGKRKLQPFLQIQPRLFLANSSACLCRPMNGLLSGQKET